MSNVTEREDLCFCYRRALSNLLDDCDSLIRFLTNVFDYSCSLNNIFIILIIMNIFVLEDDWKYIILTCAQ